MSGKSTDLTNRTFGELKVVKRAENSNSGQPRWLCECRCGKTCIVDGRFLKNGASNGTTIGKPWAVEKK